MLRKRLKRGGAAAIVLLLIASLAGCSLFGDDARVLLRSDPPIAGYTGSMLYNINASPNGDGETNQIVYRGINGASPMPLLSTSFGKGANSRTQVAQITGENGAAVNVLSMNKWGINVGLTDYLDAQVATYEQRDALNNRVCGAKVRLDFKPNIAQVVKSDKYRRAWDALFYYTIPCGVTVVAAPPATPDSTAGKTDKDKAPVIVKPNVVLDLSKAKLLGLVINQQFTPRVTGKPIVFNRGHSVTVVGGRAASYVGGWWQTPASLLSASNLIIDMVKDLDKHEWLSFGDANFGGLVYSAGDADVYASLNRIFLNRQVQYLVNFRSSTSEPWKRVLVNPVYNFEWNDFSQNYHALKGQDMPDIDDMVNQDTGLPKDIDKPDSDDSKALKEIETAGCQNCPNATLEQIQFIDATEGSRTNGQPLYAMTIRGWIGANSSLVMFGNLPSKPANYLAQAEEHRKQLGMTDCQIRRNDKGEKLPDEEQWSTDKDDQDEEWSCTRNLREGALWDMLTRDASKFGFDVVGQFRVRDNSSWASNCTGSGENTSCNLVATNRRIDAAYMFTDTDVKLQKAWTVLQTLGEVGMRKLGLSYASGAYDGSGLDFAMAQPQVYNSYYTNMADPANPYNPELLFALDARALQLPTTLGLAGEYLYGMK
jgi:hypothetical protein